MFLQLKLLIIVTKLISRVNYICYFFWNKSSYWVDTGIFTRISVWPQIYWALAKILTDRLPTRFYMLTVKIEPMAFWKTWTFIANCLELSKHLKTSRKCWIIWTLGWDYLVGQDGDFREESASRKRAGAWTVLFFFLVNAWTVLWSHVFPEIYHKCSL